MTRDETAAIEAAWAILDRVASRTTGPQAESADVACLALLDFLDATAAEVVTDSLDGESTRQDDQPTHDERLAWMKPIWERDVRASGMGQDG